MTSNIYITHIVHTNRSHISTRGLIAASMLASTLAVSMHAATTTADFNGDGRDELVVPVFKTVSGDEDAGGVAVIYGRNSGLSQTGDQFWTQDSTGVLDDADPFDHFGFARAWGDFNADGFDDLAIGVPYEDFPGALNAGAVAILYGSASGLRSAGNQFWHRGVDGVQGELEADAWFGSALAAGDFDGDGFADLVIGVPAQTVATYEFTGEIHVLFGSATGLSADRDQIWNEETPDIVSEAQDLAGFGATLACGDFDGDGFDDVAVGAPMKTPPLLVATYAGAVHVIYGSAEGLTAEGNHLLFQTPEDGDVAEAGDNFAWSLAAGDFDGDGEDDLAVGVPFEAHNQDLAGAVNVYRGSPAGLRHPGSQFWTQDSPDIKNVEHEEDQFGWSLAAGDFDGDGRDDLAIGVMREAISGQEEAGAVNVLYGSDLGLRALDNQLWHQDSNGVPDDAEPFDLFGGTLSAGDFDADGRADLAIGVWLEDLNVIDAGAMHVIYGGAHGLTKARNQFWHQDSPGIVNEAREYDYFSVQLINVLN